jgi:hypothetical protein
MVDERGQRQMRGERATAVDERQQKLRQDVVRPTADKATAALVVDERCVVGKRRRWRQTRGNDLVAVASRGVMQCDAM